jgi:hypothetical protein
MEPSVPVVRACAIDRREVSPLREPTRSLPSTQLKEAPANAREKGIGSLRWND